MNNENNTTVNPQENGNSNPETPKKKKFSERHPKATKVIKGAGIVLGITLLAVGGFACAGSHFKGDSKDVDPADEVKTEEKDI